MNSYGGKTFSEKDIDYALFESSVNSYGGKTHSVPSAFVCCLRVV